MVLTNRSNSARLLSDVAGANYVIRMDKMELRVAYVTLAEGTLLSLRQKLSAGSLLYRFLRSSLIGPVSVSAGVASTEVVLSRGSIPELVMVGVQPAVRGLDSYIRNALNFTPGTLVFAQVEGFSSCQFSHCCLF